jgi:hypothetical protein
MKLYGCKTWSLTLREEHNRVLRGTFGARRNEVTGAWTKLHKEKAISVTGLGDL